MNINPQACFFAVSLVLYCININGQQMIRTKPFPKVQQGSSKGQQKLFWRTKGPLLAVIFFSKSLHFPVATKNNEIIDRRNTKSITSLVCSMVAESYILSVCFINSCHNVPLFVTGIRFCTTQGWIILSLSLLYNIKLSFRQQTYKNFVLKS